ncbi:hypothetical protein ACWA1F_13120 [Flavobacterium sp. 3-218]
MKIKLIAFITIISIISVKAQIYTPAGTIQGVSGNDFVGIGTNAPSNILTVQGNHNNSRILLHSTGGGINENQADLMLWSSEPGLTYTGVGIGNNISNYTTVNGLLKLLNPVRGGSYLRLLDNALSLNVVSNSGIDKQALSIGSSGNVGIDVINASHKLEIAGNTFSHGAFISSISDVIGGQIVLKNPLKTENGTASSWNIYNMTSGYGNSLQFWAYDNLGCAGGMCANRFTIMDNGNVGIGNGNPANKLDVNGTIHSKEVKVDMIGWPDFVFKKEYNLPTLEEVEKHIAKKGHLENIPSEEEVLKNGINLGEMNAKLLQKIEELTLYAIEQDKKNNNLVHEIQNCKDQIDTLKKQNESLLSIFERVSKLEQQSK